MKYFKEAALFLILCFLGFACRHHTNSNQAMVERLEQQLQFENNAANPFSSLDVLHQQDSIIATSKNDIDILQVYIKKANALLQVGQEQKAVNLMDSLSRTFIISNSDRLLVEKTLALAYLRLGERTNCVNNHNAESCIFPIQGSGIQRDRYGSEKAILDML